MNTASLYPTPAPRAPELTIRRVKGIDAPIVAELRALASGSHRPPDELFTMSMRAWLEAEGEARITLVALIEEATAIADRRDYQRLLVSPNTAALPLFDRQGFLMLDEVGPQEILLVRPPRRS